jgi:simple sugar transport system substrate-binding protein
MAAGLFSQPTGRFGIENSRGILQMKKPVIGTLGVGVLFVFFVSCAQVSEQRSADSIGYQRPGVKMQEASGKLKFAFITCSVEARFFEPVKKGMSDASNMLGVESEFMGTVGVDLKAQAEMIGKAAEDGYDGIAVNIIDPEAFDEAIQETIDEGVPVVGFNVDDHTTANARLSCVNQNFYEAGRILGEYALPFVSENEHVLMTMHDEGISALEDRLRGMQGVLESKKVRWTVIISGNDSVKAAEVIADALRKEGGIKAILGTGQSDTEAAGRAIEKYFAGQGYWSIGFDLSGKTLQLIQDGHISCTIDQQPYIQGFYPVVQLTHYLRYGIKPSDIDAGAAVIDKSNVQQVTELTKLGYR